MKYIKTYNGIFRVREWNPNEFPNNQMVPVYGNAQDYNKRAFHKKNIIKEADTIEELCDEFVIDAWVSGIHILTHTLENVKAYTRPCDKYGAIWTKAGLKYVAKINSAGEFELL